MQAIGNKPGAPGQLTASASSNDRLPLRTADGSLSGSWLLAGRAGAVPPFFGLPASAQAGERAGGGVPRGRGAGWAPASTHVSRTQNAASSLHC